MKKIKEKYIIAQRVFKLMEDDHVGAYSAQCAYYTILSFIPFIILVITLIQYTGIQPQTLFEAITKIVPESMNDMVLGGVFKINRNYFDFNNIYHMVSRKRIVCFNKWVAKCI